MQDYVLGKDVLIYFKWDVGRRYVVWRMVAGQEPGMEEEHGQEEEAGHAEVPISCFQVGCWKFVVLLCVVEENKLTIFFVTRRYDECRRKLDLFAARNCACVW